MKTKEKTKQSGNSFFGISLNYFIQRKIMIFIFYKKVLNPFFLVFRTIIINYSKDNHIQVTINEMDSEMAGIKLHRLINVL